MNRIHFLDAKNREETPKQATEGTSDLHGVSSQSMISEQVEVVHSLIDKKEVS